MTMDLGFDITDLRLSFDSNRKNKTTDMDRLLK